VGPPGDYPFVSLAPDASQAAVQRLDETTGAPDLWLFDLSSGRATRLTASPVNEEDPVWSPDGSRILFAKHPAIGAEARLRHLRPTHPLDEGVGEPDVEGHPTDWSRDGRLVIVQRATPDTGSDLAVHRVSGGPPLAVFDSIFNERHGRLSPDGRLLAYSSDVSGRFEVYVRSLARDADTVQVSSAGGAHPRWRRDGRELYYLSAAGVLMAVPAATRPRISAGRPVPLFDARPPLPLPFLDTLYDVTPDGQRFLVAATDQPVTRSFTVVVEALAPLR
jgi:Tol biopolymer transport system component